MNTSLKKLDGPETVSVWPTLISVADTLLASDIVAFSMVTIIVHIVY